MRRATLEQVEAVVDRLTVDDKISLVRRLEADTLSPRWSRLVRSLDRRRRGRRFSAAEIQREIDAVRLKRRRPGHSRRH